jgi:hypothetical protein
LVDLLHPAPRQDVLTTIDDTNRGHAMDETYRIRIRGHLDDRWSELLCNLEISREEDGTTLLAGPIVDQAALHGVLARIRDLGLPLMAVERTDDANPGASARSPGEGEPPLP